MDKKDQIFKMISDKLKQANRNNMKSKYVYSKILSSLKDISIPIINPSDLNNIKNIGIKTREMIIETVFNNETQRENKNEKIKGLSDKKELDLIPNTNNFMTNEINILEKGISGNAEFQEVLVESVSRNIKDRKINIYVNNSEKSEFFQDKYTANNVVNNDIKISEYDKNHNELKKRKLNNSEKINTKNDSKKLKGKLNNSIKIATKNENEDLKIKLDHMAPCQNIDSNEIKLNGSKKAKKKMKYLPAFKSGAYAILKVLNQEDGISKHIISHRGNKYSNIEFNVNQRYSAWSSIKTLIEKKLVYKEEKKYFLTDLGRLTSDYLFENESTLIEDEKMPLLIIDSREIKSKKDRSFFQRELEKDVKCETRNLHVGDFLWVYDEFVLDYIVERKKGSDFCSSISDGRFNEQKKRLLSTGISNIFYIVEGLKERDLAKIGINYGYSCLAATKNEGLTVIETEDINETIEVVKIIDKIVKESFKRSQFLDDDNDICKLRYDDFIDKGTKNNNLKVSDILLISLLSVRGLSYEKAKAITEKYTTLRNFMEAGKEIKIIEDLCSIKTSKGSLSKSIAKRICKIIFDSD